MTNKTMMPEPDAYIIQQEETRQNHEVDVKQEEWGFEKNNPRLKLIGSLYSSEKMEAYANARVRAALEEAAELCDRFAERDMHPGECAGAIRALIPKEDT